MTTMEIIFIFVFLIAVVMAFILFFAFIIHGEYIFSLSIAAIFIILTMLISPTLDEIEKHQYPRVGIITKVNETTNVVTVEDMSGFVWTFTGTEDWYVADVVAMIMDSKGSLYIDDDAIVDINYQGRLETWQNYSLEQ